VWTGAVITHQVTTTSQSDLIRLWPVHTAAVSQVSQS